MNLGLGSSLGAGAPPLFLLSGCPADANGGAPLSMGGWAEEGGWSLTLSLPEGSALLSLARSAGIEGESDAVI